jgi:hypothetical protein
MKLGIQPIFFLPIILKVESFGEWLIKGMLFGACR